MEPLSPREEFWAPVSFEDEAPSLFNGNNYHKNSFSTNDNFISNYNANDKMPKNEIIINEDQYEKARHQPEISSTFTNPIPTEPKFKSINSNNNDERFGSVGSEPTSNSGKYFFILI